jgi:hypothetical protein
MAKQYDDAPGYWARQAQMLRARSAGEDVESPASPHHAAWRELESWELFLSLQGPGASAMALHRPIENADDCRDCGEVIERGVSGPRCAACDEASAARREVA